MILQSSNKHYCKLDKTKTKVSFPALILSITKMHVSFQSLLQIEKYFFLSNYCIFTAVQKVRGQSTFLSFPILFRFRSGCKIVDTILFYTETKLYFATTAPVNTSKHEQVLMIFKEATVLNKILIKSLDRILIEQDISQKFMYKCKKYERKELNI